MSASAIGWITAGFVVAISSALIIRFRKPRQAGEVQTYSRAAQASMLIVGILAITAAIAVFATTPVKDSKDWFAIVAAFIGGIAALFCFYYYLCFSVKVTPESITINDPFRGTSTITHENLVSIAETAFKGASQTKFIFDDDGRLRAVTLAHSKFDLTPFTEQHPSR